MNPDAGRRRRRTRWALVGAVLVSCSFDKADRWISAPILAESAEPRCMLDTLRCGAGLERCVETTAGPAWSMVDDCGARGLVCARELLACAVCEPLAQTCAGQNVLLCDELGQSQSVLTTCDTSATEACRDGRCVHLCTAAAEQRSNVGCEYWAVDLDNAVAEESLNAAAQQFAVVISNPQPDLPAHVRIEMDEAAPGQPAAVSLAAEADIGPFNLAVFPLGPREVDGSPPGQYNTGTHTAHSRAAFRITSNVPVVAYQFNPLENVDVFSNDASLLKPVEALRGEPGALADAYVVLGWPQTISSTDDPNTNFSPSDPIDFRAFLTLVATRDDTRVRVTPATRTIGGGSVPALAAGETLELDLDAFEVLNLESDDFGSDFTGSVVAANAPIAVFSGSEASDSPRFDRLSERRCCADHLEEQLDPIRTAGRHFVAPLSFNRHLALSNAGAALTLEEEPEVFRVISVHPDGATVRTSLGEALAEFRLNARGEMREIVTTRDFWLESDNPVMLGNVTASQSAAGIPSSLPGGDPSFIIVPPVEQFRSSYVFLTPDRYAFDFLRIMAPSSARISLDNQLLEQIPGCALETGTLLDRPLDPRLGFRVYRCQLSFPVIDPAIDGDADTLPGIQRDGVHRLFSDRAVGVIVDGFDRNVSYGYAAGTELREITPE